MSGETETPDTPRKYRVILQPEAYTNMEAAFERFEAFNPDFARRWVKGLWEAIQSLDTFPLRCALARENDYFEEELRHHLYRQGNTVYRIIFTLVGGDTVSVVTIRHAAQDTLKPDESASE